MHINKEELEKFQQGAMNSEEMIAFLTQIDNDDLSLDKFLEKEEASGSITAPSYLKEQILEKSHRQKTPKILLWQYTLQTAAGVAAALILLFSVTNMDYSSVWKERSLYQRQTSLENMFQEQPDQSPAERESESPMETDSENAQDSSASRQEKHLSDLTRKLQQNITCTTGSVTAYLFNLPDLLFGR